MATSKSLLGCLKHATGRVPKDVAALAADGKRQPMMQAIEQHIENLKSRQKELTTQHKNNVDNFLAQGIDGSVPGSYTKRPDDSFNELNTFKPKSLKTLLKNVVQRVGSVSAALNHKMLRDNNIDEKDRAVLEHFNSSFNPRFTARIEKLFKPKSSSFHRYEDMIQYFPQRKKGNLKEIEPIVFQDADGNYLKDGDGNIITSNLDTPLKEAMAATAYEWLGTNGRMALEQTDSSLRSLLELDKDDQIPDSAWEHLQATGVNGEALARNLGRKALQRIGIEAKPEADALAMSRLEMSLGYMAIAALEDMKVLERQEVFAGLTDDGSAPTIGIAALRLGKDLTEAEVFYNDATAGPDGRKGTPTVKLFKLKSNNYDGDYLRSPEYLEPVEKLMSVAPNAFDKLFANEPDIKSFAWSKIRLPKVMRIGRSKEEANSKQRANIQKYSDIPYQRSTETMEVFKALEGHPLQRILGIAFFDGKLDVRTKSIEGINRGIMRDYQNVMDWENQALEREAAGESSDFYIPSTFQNNMRMGQKGPISPQGSKIHRNLFSPKGWQVSFDPRTDKDIDTAFHEAIAFAFEIESGKVGGVKIQLRKVRELLHNKKNLSMGEFPEHYAIRGAIEALKEFHKTGKMSEDMMNVIADGVDVTGTKVHGLKALTEYARYEAHKSSRKRNKGKFTTDIYKEIDGVSNGPIIGMLQLIPGHGDKQATLAALAMGGISVNPQEVNLDELLANPALNDAYQRMGQEWANQLLLVKQEFLGKGEKKRIEYDNTLALERILGKFNQDSGVIANTVRKLSKPRTMQTIYGAGIKKQTRILTEANVIEDGIYGKVESFLQKVIEADEQGISVTDDVKADFQSLLDDINTLIGGRYKDTINNYMTRGELDAVKIQRYKLVDWQVAKINKAVSDTYGQAMERAIEKTFSGVIDARQPFNDAVQLAVTNYNTILKTKVDNLIAVHKAQGKEFPEVITNEELDEILGSIDHMVPRIKTPLHTKSDPSYLPLVSVGRNKNYGLRSQVTQSYNGSMPLNKGYAEGIPFLDRASAGPMVRAIQMIDSMVANHLMSLDQQILNNHDGFSHSIADSDKIREETNQRFFELMRDYSLGEAFAEMHENSQKSVEAAFEENDISFETVRENLIDDGVVTKDMAQSLLGIEGEYMATEISRIEEKQGVSYRDAVKIFMRENTPVTEWFVNDVIDYISFNSERMAEQVTENKSVIMENVTEIAQYPDKGKGITISPENPQEKIFGKVRVDKVLSIDAKNTSKTIKTMAAAMEDMFGSSTENASTSPNDYRHGPTKVDSLNVTQVFDSLVQQDIHAQYGSVQDSDPHVSHMKRVLDSIVAKVMTPIEVFRDEHSANDRETTGLYTKDKINGENRIWIQTQKISTHPQPGMLGQGIRMSAAEVYTHEMLHHITHGGLKKSPFLRKQAYDLYDLARKEFEKMYGANAFRVFMNDVNTDLNDPANAFEIMAAKERWEYIFNPKKNPDNSHNGIDEFISFGVSNENFRKELGRLTIDDKTIKARKSLGGIWGGNIQSTIVNLFNLVMDVIHQSFLKQQHSTKVDQELENLALAIAQVEGRQKTALYSSLVRAENKATALAVEIDEKTKKLASKAMDATQLGRVITKLKQLPELDNMISHQMRLVLNWYNNSEQGLIASMVTEMQGTTDRMKPLHHLLSRRKRVIDAAKEEAATNMRAAVNSWFKRELSSSEKTTITKATLKTDLSSLMDRYTLRALQGFVEDSRSRELEIQKIVQSIQNDPDLQPYQHFFKNAADDLGYYMITSSARPGGIPMMNAHNIALMHGTKHADALNEAAFGKAVDLIDRLASLSSLRYVKNNHKLQLVSLMKEDISSIESVMHHHKLVKEQAFRDSFNYNPALMQKGYTKQILNARIQYEQGTAADKERFENMGFVMQRTPITRDPDDPVQTPIFMFKSTLGTVNDLQSGIMSFTSNSAKGASAYNIQQQIGNTVNASNQAATNNQAMLAVTARKLNNMFKATPRPLQQQGAPAANSMVPKFDVNGDITELRYVMNETTKDNVLEQFSEVDAVLASMSSQIVDKKNTPEINKELVVALKDMYDEEFSKYPEAYVEVSPYSSNQRYRDIYHMIPPKTKQQIESIWGSNRMYVSQDIIDLAFGQRKYSIIDMFGKDKKTRNLFESTMTMVLTAALGFNNPFNKDEIGTSQGRAINRAKAVEDTMTQLTKLGKSNIIVRNLAVSRGNYASNMAYLKSKGIPLEKMSLLSREAILSSLKYQADNTKLKTLVQQREVTSRKASINQTTKDTMLKNYDRAISRLENELALNPSTAMIAAGLMPAIVDDVDTANIQSPYVFGVDAVIEKGLSKLPKKAESVARTLFMTDDTEGYKMLNNGVKMTDYVGRYVLYHHYTGQGMSHKDAISAVTDEFINFDLPTHKTIEYLNNVGLVWFSKYQLRVLKHIKNLVKNNPFSTLATFILGSFIGNNNILNSVPGLTKDTFQAFGDPASALTSSADQILYVDGAATVATLPFE